MNDSTCINNRIIIRVDTLFSAPVIKHNKKAFVSKLMKRQSKWLQLNLLFSTSVSTVFSAIDVTSSDLLSILCVQWRVDSFCIQQRLSLLLWSVTVRIIDCGRNAAQCVPCSAQQNTILNKTQIVLYHDSKHEFLVAIILYLRHFLPFSTLQKMTIFPAQETSR